MTSTTPLLLLLDSILSQEPDRIREARTRIRQIVANASDSNPALKAAALAPMENGSASYCLLQDVNMVLAAFPNLASVASSHDGSLPLHFAASVGNVQVATRILSQYPTAASTPNTKGKIPLHYAAREGRSDMVAYFLCATPDTAKIPSKKKKLALHFAAGDGHTDVVRQLLQVYPEGASLPSKKGKLALHFASRWGHTQIASDLLFVHPQGVRCVDWDGSLPLHDAAREGQVIMSKFLIERYPAGLSIANIRGEIPLFPAVRSGNMDLVILYLQGWSMGGMHILKSVSADDNIEDWDWNIVELCLRGAVDNFSDCALMKGKEPPAVCFTVEREDYRSGLHAKASSSSSSKVTEICCQQASSLDQNPASTLNDAVAGEGLQRSLVAVAKSSGDDDIVGCQLREVFAVDPMPRSKSPILELDGNRSQKRVSIGCGNERKRARSGTWHEGDEYGSSAERRRKFIALHAALSCGASSHVVRCVLKKHPIQVSEADESGQFPLHIAVRSSACSTSDDASLDGKEGKVVTAAATDDGKAVVTLVLEDILKPYPEATFVSDCRGRLPLHLAIASRADFSIVQELIKTNPSSGVEVVQTKDSRFANKPPIYMATEFDCDLSTTYLLLRGDPSVVYLTAKA